MTKLLRKGLVLAMLVAFTVQFLFIPVKWVAAAGISWSMRSASRGFTLIDNGAGITSMNAEGEAVTLDHSAAVMTTPLGYEAFEAKFDLVWSDQNPVDGDADYGSRFLYFFLSTSDSISDSGTSAYPAKNQITVKGRHIDGRNLEGAAKSGVVSLGLDESNQRITFANINAEKTAECHLTLSNNVLTFSVYRGGEVLTSMALTYSEGTLNAKEAKYLGVAVYNNIAFSVRNLSILSTDYNGNTPAYEGKWLLRDMDKGFTQYAADGITTVRDEGNAAAGSAAIWTEPVGTTRFLASFDLVWDADNVTEGETGYLSNFLSVYLTDQLSFPDGSGGFLPAPGFRVETKHFQAEDPVDAVEDCSARIVDFGGKDLNNIGEGRTSKVYMELRRNILSLYIMDGDTRRGRISYTFREGCFTEDVSRYIGFSIWGNTVCSIKNFTIYDVADDNEPETNSQNGAGFDFSGGNTYLVSENAVSAPHTIEAWVKIPVDIGNTTAVGTIFKNDQVTFEVSTNGNPRVVFNGRSFTLTSVDLRTDCWTHLAFVCDHAQDKILCYINGRLAGETNAVVSDYSGESIAYLGNNSRMSRSFHAQAADVRLWDDARTAEEIRANMNLTVDMTSEGLLANYLLTEAGERFADRLGGSDLLLKKRVTYVTPEENEDYDYTIAVIPDTQVLVGGYTDFSAFTDMTNWLKENQESQKIAFALQVGDLCNDPTDAQFSLAQQAMQILDGTVPYAIVPGNHDYDTTSSDKRDTSVYNKYFAYDKYKEFSYFGGAYEAGSMDNTYWFFEAGDEKYMVVALEFGPRDSVLEWACKITEDNSDRKVIVLTHANLHYDGELMDDNSENAPTNYMNGGYLDVENDPPNNGDDVWEKYTSKYKNIAFVISGHVKSDNIVSRYDEGENGNTVCQMLVNAQGLDFDMWLDKEAFGADGLGMVALLRFSERGTKVTVRYYSPYLNKYLNEENQYTFTLGEALYDLEITGGEGSGSYPSGSIVDISAAIAPEGQKFDHWEIVSGEAVLADARSANTTLTISKSDAAVKAVYISNTPAVSSDSSDTKGDSSDISVERPAPESSAPVASSPDTAAFSFPVWICMFALISGFILYSSALLSRKHRQPATEENR